MSKRKKTTETISTKIQCNLCSAKISGEAAMEKHILNHEKYRLLSCNSCSYKTLYKRCLRDHNSTVCGTRSYKCNFCLYSCETQKALVLHYENYHGSVDKNKVSLIYHNLFYNLMHKNSIKDYCLELRNIYRLHINEVLKLYKGL